VVYADILIPLGTIRGYSRFDRAGSTLFKL
jgi:hypothetical protein